MTILTRDQILAAQDLQTKEVDVPEWGGSVKIKELNGEEYASILRRCLTSNGGKPQVDFTGLMVPLVAASLIDDQGERMFTEREVELVGKKSSAALQRIFIACQDFAGFPTEDGMKEQEGN